MILIILLILIIILCIIFGYNAYNNRIQGIDYYGVIAYVNTNNGKNYLNGHVTGIKWECVEYVRRWLMIVKGVTFEDVATAEDIWELKTAKSLKGETLAFINGKGIPPVGALLIYKKTNKYPYGHVAVVVDVNDDIIYVAEQNYSLKKWQGYSRRVDRKDPVIGWKNIN